MLPNSLLALGATAIVVLFISRRQGKALALAALLMAGFGLSAGGPFTWEGTGLVFAWIFLAAMAGVITFSRSQRERVSLFLLSAFSLVGAAGTDDLFTFYLFWETACLASYFLAFSPKSKESAFRYVVASIASSSFVFLAISLTYAETNSVAFSALPLLADPSLVAGLLATGFGLRALLFPLQFWAPPLYSEAPVDTSAFFAGVLSKLGVLGLVKAMVALPSLSSLLLAASLVTMASGNLFAFVQKDVKKVLAFSSIAHLGYMLLGFSMITPGATIAGLLHALNHAAAVTLAFLAVGSETPISDFSLPPLRRFSFIVGALSLAGFPGLSVFTGEFSLLSSLPAGIALFVGANMAFSALYYYRLLMCGESEKSEMLSFSQEMALALLALFVIASGLFPLPAEAIVEVMGG